MNDGPAMQGRHLILRRMLFDKFGERVCLLREPLGIFIVRKQVRQFVAKDSRTTGLEADHRRSRRDLRTQSVEDLEQERFPQRQHSKVIERSSTAERGLRHDDLMACRFEDLHRGPCRVGEKNDY